MFSMGKRLLVGIIGLGRNLPLYCTALIFPDIPSLHYVLHLRFSDPYYILFADSRRG